jgi:hypothetical protein
MVGQAFSLPGLLPRAASLVGRFPRTAADAFVRPVEGRQTALAYAVTYSAKCATWPRHCSRTSNGSLHSSMRKAWSRPIIPLRARCIAPSSGAKSVSDAVAHKAKYCRSFNHLTCYMNMQFPARRLISLR